MVRMSNCLTLACATLLVAGNAASAADKASRLVVDSEQAQELTSYRDYPITLRQRFPHLNNATNANFGDLGGGCSCLWFNGSFDGRDGQASHEGGEITYGEKAADDFYLCEGFVYDLESISATLLTNSLPILTKARLELYADCGGRPSGDPLYVLENPVIDPNQPLFDPTDPDNLRVVNFTFRVADQDQDDLDCGNIVLKGGTYWVSVVGLSDCQGSDVSYFATAGNGIVKGSQAHKLSGDDDDEFCNQFFYTLYDWEPLEDCCIGCTDLAFTVCAEPCKILIDNGVGDRQFITLDEAGNPVLDGQGRPVLRPVGARSERSNSGRNSRAADDFVVPPCSDIAVCYIEGCIYTNCDPRAVGFFEIYANDCDEPSFVIGSTPLYQGTATCLVDLGYDVQIENRTLRAVRAEFHDLSFTLQGGRQYWISVGINDTFSATERAYFCYNADCRRDDECLVRFNPGHILAPNAGVDEWTSVGRDFSFLIAGDTLGSTAPGSNTATATCAADFDNDGSPTVADIFSFLRTWFAGCP